MWRVPQSPTLFPMSDASGKQQNTAAFYGQAVASFAVAMAATAIGIFKLNADAWVRAFLGIAVLYLVTSAFTLAKVIRDRQEATERAYHPFEKL
ncbi:hypothetical protein GCM10018780_63120 [Streptomyces lanatus]|nr:hypothetical protein GCM10018780_63120 [Streptomyces lanatus]